MNLGEFALICFAYGAMDHDDSLGQLERRVQGTVDLSQEGHRLALLHWLNHWQCRQFSPAYHEVASSGLIEWHQEFDPTLPPKRAHLWDIPAFTVEEYGAAFDSLAGKPASYRTQGGKSAAVSFGPVAASKILFVLRPKVFVVWDQALRASLRYDGSGRSYVDLLLRLRDELLELQDQCRSVKLRLDDLPEALGRPLSTPAQLLGEFYTATVTREVVAPSRQQVFRWLQWYTAQADRSGQEVTAAPPGASRPAVPPPR